MSFVPKTYINTTSWHLATRYSRSPESVYDWSPNLIKITQTTELLSTQLVSSGRSLERAPNQYQLHLTSHRCFPATATRWRPRANRRYINRGHDDPRFAMGRELFGNLVKVGPWEAQSTATLRPVGKPVRVVLERKPYPEDGAEPGRAGVEEFDLGSRRGWWLLSFKSSKRESHARA